MGSSLILRTFFFLLAFHLCSYAFSMILHEVCPISCHTICSITTILAIFDFLYLYLQLSFCRTSSNFAQMAQFNYLEKFPHINSKHSSYEEVAFFYHFANHTNQQKDLSDYFQFADIFYSFAAYFRVCISSIFYACSGIRNQICSLELLCICNFLGILGFWHCCAILHCLIRLCICRIGGLSEFEVIQFDIEVFISFRPQCEDVTSMHHYIVAYQNYLYNKSDLERERTLN